MRLVSNTINLKQFSYLFAFPVLILFEIVSCQSACSGGTSYLKPGHRNSVVEQEMLH